MKVIIRMKKVDGKLSLLDNVRIVEMRRKYGQTYEETYEEFNS